MSNLVVVGFPKVEEAEEVRRELVTIQQEHLITLEDVVVLEHGDDGHAPHARLIHTNLSHIDEEQLKEPLECARKQAEAPRLG